MSAPQLPREKLKEVHEEVTKGNGLETDATRGMTLRELFLEQRGMMIDFTKQSGTWVSRREAYGVLVIVFGTIIGLHFG